MINLDLTKMATTLMDIADFSETERAVTETAITRTDSMIADSTAWGARRTITCPR